MDYFLARYYSSTQGRFTSPDEFKGGPDELFEDSPSENPLLYAEPSSPQTLNKYHYAYNNPLRYIDPDGHQGQGLVERILQSAPVQGAKDVVVGVAKSGANVAIGAGNIGNLAIHGDGRWDDGTPVAPLTKPYEPSGVVQDIAMRATDVLMLVSGLGGKAGPANVIVAESKESTLVTSEVGSASASISEATAGTARAARREAMRGEGIPTSQQPRSQVSPRGGAGRQYQYEVPGPGGGIQTKIVTNQLRDRNHGPHYEAGVPKSSGRADPGGRLRHANNKTKVNY